MLAIFFIHEAAALWDVSYATTAIRTGVLPTYRAATLATGAGHERFALAPQPDEIGRSFNQPAIPKYALGGDGLQVAFGVTLANIQRESRVLASDLRIVGQELRAACPPESIQRIDTGALDEVAHL
jgi:hypothetical protein